MLKKAFMDMLRLGTNALLKVEFRDLSGRYRNLAGEEDFLMLAGARNLTDKVEDFKVRGYRDYLALKGAVEAFVLAKGITYDEDYPSRFFTAVEKHFKRHFDLGYFSVRELKGIAEALEEDWPYVEDALENVPVDEEFLSALKGEEKFRATPFPFNKGEVPKGEATLILRGAIEDWLYDNEDFFYLERNGEAMGVMVMEEFPAFFNNISAKGIRFAYDKKENSLFFELDENGKRETYKITPLISLPKETLQELVEMKLKRIRGNHSLYLEKFSFAGKSLFAVEDGIFSKEELITILTENGRIAEEIREKLLDKFTDMLSLQFEERKREHARESEREAEIDLLGREM